MRAVLARCRNPVVTAGTTGDHRDVAVKLGWQPAGVATLVAGGAIRGS